MKKNYTIVTTALFISVLSNAQVGINTKQPNSTLDVVAKVATGNSENFPEGILIPRVDRERAESMTNVENSTLIYINDATTGTAAANSPTEYVKTSGYYFYDTRKAKWQGINYKTNFYYSPSILLPTNSDDTRLGTTGYSLVGDLYTVDLYYIFSNQFQNPIATSVLQATNPNASLANFVKKSTDYDYFVSYADQTVFSDITLTLDGKLSYKVLPNSIIRNGSFMNIVLKEN